MRALGALGVLLALAACNSSTLPDGGGNANQVSYSYAGCTAGSNGCANDLTYLCAMNTEKAKYDACTVASDCARVHVSNCAGYGLCDSGPAVNLAHAEDFREAFQKQTDLYCANNHCTEGPTCVAGSTVTVTCDEGHCATHLSDGGT